MKIAVTGASGFIGKRLLELWSSKYAVQPLSLRAVSIADLPLDGIDCLVHLAGKAHDMKSSEEAPYFAINYELTKALADRALVQGVSHFIFVSTVKVFGDANDEEFNEQSECNPQDAYGKSKLLAEQYLQSIASDTFKVSIVRPPMVYGPYAKGNVIKLMRLADKPYPLPFANIQNRRSVVFVDNLVAMIEHIINNKAEGIFIAGDMEPVSSLFLMEEIRKSMAKPTRLFALPIWLRRFIQYSNPALHDRLFGSFVVQTMQTNQRLNFTPPFTTKYGIAKMVEWYRNAFKTRALK